MKKVEVCVKPIKFANKQSYKAFKDLPKKILEIFAGELEDVIAHGNMPSIKHDFLPEKMVELKENGSPAFRCVYVVQDDVIVVLHSFKKTSEGPDRPNLKTAKKRLRSLDVAQYC
jgi:phage-related protein